MSDFVFVAFCGFCDCFVSRMFGLLLCKNLLALGVKYRNTNNDQYKISTLILITYHKVNNRKCPLKGTFRNTGSNYIPLLGTGW